MDHFISKGARRIQSAVLLVVYFVTSCISKIVEKLFYGRHKKEYRTVRKIDVSGNIT